MRTTRGERLQLLVDLARKEEDIAAKGFVVAKKQWHIECEQFERLKEYYQGYTQDFASKTQGLRASEMGRSRVFLNSIDQALEQQRTRVKITLGTLGEQEQNWKEKHRKVKNLLEYHQRWEKQAQQAHDKLEQKMLDELSLSRYQRP